MVNPIKALRGLVRDQMRTWQMTYLSNVGKMTVSYYRGGGRRDHRGHSPILQHLNTLAFEHNMSPLYGQIHFFE